MPLLEFIEGVYGDRDNTDAPVLKAALEIVGDLAAKIAGVVPVLLSKPFVTQFVQEGQTSGDVGLVESASWVAGVLQKQAQG